MKIIPVVIAVLVFLSGCKGNTLSSPAMYTFAPADNNSFSFGVKTDGFYSAADIDKNTFTQKYFCIESDMSSFPLLFVLQCRIKGKIPVLSVPYTSSAIDMISFARQAGDIKSPLFIDLFPCVRGKISDEAYDENYKTAYTLLKKFAPESKIIRSCNVGDSKQLFSNCDYRGIYYYENDIYGSFERTSLLKKSTSDKPAFIFFGISHYNNITSSYSTFDAAKYLGYFYNTVCPSLTNTEAVIYCNMQNKVNNYKISDTPEMTLAYKKL